MDVNSNTGCLYESRYPGVFREQARSCKDSAGKYRKLSKVNPFLTALSFIPESIHAPRALKLGASV